MAGFLHHMAGNQQGGPGLGHGPETVPQVGPEHRIKSHGWLIQDQQAGASHQGTGQRHPAQLAAGEVAGFLPRLRFKPDGGDRLRGLGAALAVHGAEVADIGFDREVRIHAGGLGHVTHPVSQVSVPGGQTQHLDRAGRERLDAHDGPHERSLAAAGRTSSPVIWPAWMAKSRPRRMGAFLRVTCRAVAATAMLASVTAGAVAAEWDINASECWESPRLNSPGDEFKLDPQKAAVNYFEWKNLLWMCRLSHMFDLAALKWVGGLTSPHQYLVSPVLGVNGHGATSACNDQPFTARGFACRAWLYCVPAPRSLARPRCRRPACRG
ncbi:hypothetical protein AHiyo4_16650 [Arthrobacter sp. Hiyo4]|nr:hypothetical protein AHiyo4_16650 [Arthrobacter sp. Hiyo4]